MSWAKPLSSNDLFVTFQQNMHGAAFEDIDGVSTTPTHLQFSPYHLPHIFAPHACIQETALEPNFPIIDKRAFVQREIPKTMGKVANDPPGTRIGRVAISNSDQHGASTHFFAVCFEIKKPLNKFMIDLYSTYTTSEI
jgi:hypothetical protein